MAGNLIGINQSSAATVEQDCSFIHKRTPPVGLGQSPAENSVRTRRPVPGNIASSVLSDNVQNDKTSKKPFSVQAHSVILQHDTLLRDLCMSIREENTGAPFPAGRPESREKQHGGFFFALPSGNLVHSFFFSKLSLSAPL